MSKEREAFQECYKTSRDYKFYVKHEMSKKQIFEFKNGKYVVDCVNDGWKIWQAAKAQAVPEGFVLVSKDTLNKALNPNDYDEAVCSANELLAVIEAQHQSSTPGCPDEP